MGWNPWYSSPSQQGRLFTRHSSLVPSLVYSPFVYSFIRSLLDSRGACFTVVWCTDVMVCAYVRSDIGP